MVGFVNESYFLYNKNNMTEQTFKTEINTLISVYGSISYFDKKSINVELVEIWVQIVSFNGKLKLSVVKNKIKNTLDFQLTKINGTPSVLNDKKIHSFSFTEKGSTRKLKIMNERIKAVIIRGQQKFDLYDGFNPVQIQIDDNRILNTL